MRRNSRKIQGKILMDYDVFEEVLDEGQETIGSRWVVTEKKA